MAVDLNETTSLGVAWALPNDGHWQSLSDLMQYASDFLEVPIDQNTGGLYPFKYVQKGTATVYYPESNTLRSGSSLLNLLVSNGPGSVYVNESPITSFPDQCQFIHTGSTEDCELNGGPCRRTTTATDGDFEASLFSGLIMDLGKSCARHRLWDFQVAGAYYVGQDPEMESVQHSHPLICDDETGPVVCVVESVEELIEPPSVSPTDPQYDQDLSIRLMRVNADSAINTSYFQNDNNLNRSTLAMEAGVISLGVDLAIDLPVNGVCAVSVAERSGLSIEIEDGFSADDAASTPNCAR